MAEKKLPVSEFWDWVKSRIWPDTINSSRSTNVSGYWRIFLGLKLQIKIRLITKKAHNIHHSRRDTEAFFSFPPNLILRSNSFTLQQENPHNIRGNNPKISQTKIKILCNHCNVYGVTSPVSGREGGGEQSVWNNIARHIKLNHTKKKTTASPSPPYRPGHTSPTNTVPSFAARNPSALMTYDVVFLHFYFFSCLLFFFPPFFFSFLFLTPHFEDESKSKRYLMPRARPSSIHFLLTSNLELQKKTE